MVHSLQSGELLILQQSTTVVQNKIIYISGNLNVSYVFSLCAALLKAVSKQKYLLDNDHLTK